MKRLGYVAAAIALLPLAATAAQDFSAQCAAIAQSALPDTQLAASLVAASASWSPVKETANPVQPAAAFAAKPFAVGAPFCRVEGTIGADIGFELWLPEPSRWNSRLLGAGVGGDAGVFNYEDLARGVAHGYAAATTDTGHKAAQRDWMLGPPQRLEEFERTAEHRLAQTSQTLIRQFYGKPAEHHYFLGCSGGGRQALKEMQDYPEDYDGLIAGAPGPQTSEMTTRRMWELLLREQHPGVMSAADWQHVADAATAQCDAQDGVRDGIVADPRACRFDVHSLRCPAKAAGGFCLSPEQLSLAATIYAPLHDDSGRVLDEGILPGVLVDAGRSRLAPAIFGQAVRHKRDWDGRDFDVSRDYNAMRRALIPKVPYLSSVPLARNNSVGQGAGGAGQTRKTDLARSCPSGFRGGWLNLTFASQLGVDPEGELFCFSDQWSEDRPSSIRSIRRRQWRRGSRFLSISHSLGTGRSSINLPASRSAPCVAATACGDSPHRRDHNGGRPQCRRKQVFLGHVDEVWLQRLLVVLELNRT